MISQEIKQHIIDKINDVDDELLLDEVYHILNVGNENSSKYIFSDEQKNILDTRIEEINNGFFLTDEDASKDLDKWLKK